MRHKALPKPTFNADLIAEDIALKGWSANELSRRAGVSHETVYRFLRGEFQTAKTAKKLAAALGYSLRRYIVRPDLAGSRR